MKKSPSIDLASSLITYLWIYIFLSLLCFGQYCSSIAKKTSETAPNYTELVSASNQNDQKTRNCDNYVLTLLSEYFAENCSEMVAETSPTKNVSLVLYDSITEKCHRILYALCINSPNNLRLTSAFLII